VIIWSPQHISTVFFSNPTHASICTLLATYLRYLSFAIAYQLPDSDYIHERFVAHLDVNRGGEEG